MCFPFFLLVKEENPTSNWQAYIYPYLLSRVLTFYVKGEGGFSIENRSGKRNCVRARNRNNRITS